MGYQIYVKTRHEPRFEIWDFKIYSTRTAAMIALQRINKKNLFLRGSKWDIRKVRTVKKTGYAQRLNRLTGSV